MKVKTIVPVISKLGQIDAGWEFEADLKDRFYVIKEGFFTGSRIHQTACEVVGEEKLYTEKEWNDLKEHHLSQLIKEREQTATFQGLARDMTEEVKKKNKEIEKLSFLVECFKLALKVSCDAIETLKEKKVH